MARDDFTMTDSTRPAGCREVSARRSEQAEAKRRLILLVPGEAGAGWRPETTKHGQRAHSRTLRVFGENLPLYTNQRNTRRNVSRICEVFFVRALRNSLARHARPAEFGQRTIERGIRADVEPSPTKIPRETGARSTWTAILP